MNCERGLGAVTNEKSGQIIRAKNKMTPHGGLDYPALTENLRRIAHQAAREVMAVYQQDIEVRHKDDRSPVTDADIRAERVILQELARLAPNIPVIAEEAASEGDFPDVDDVFFLVDPLDGTKEFIHRNGEFTVNIALIVDRIPVIGVVYAPAKKRLFYGAGPGQAFEQNLDPTRDVDQTGAPAPRHIQTRPPPQAGLIAVASRSHRNPETDKFLQQFNVTEFVIAGSSLKFCLVATGEADIYPRLGPTMEWDTAAGHAVLNAAGGSVTKMDGEPLLYGKTETGFKNPLFVARGQST